MAVLPIIIAPDPRLKLRCKPVPAVDDDIRRLMDDMLETMYLAPGIGLAAPQIGVAKRVIVVDVSRAPLRLVNPELIAESEDMAVYEEGCLSLPDHYADVERPAVVTVRYLDETGKRRETTFEGLAATCIQHEMDHLDGTLFVDRVSALKRNMILRKLTKLKRLDEKDRQKSKAVA